MTRILLLILLFALLPYRLLSQDGLLLIEFGHNDIRDRAVPLYAAPGDTTPARMYQGERTLETAIQPFIGGLGNGAVYYRCAGETEKRWAIAAEDSANVFWIDKDSLTHFVRWQEWWLYAYCVSSSEPLRLEADDKAKRVKIPEGYRGYFTVSVVEGDWLFARMGAGCGSYEAEEKLPETTGWVRWRKNGKILAHVTYPE